MDPRPKEVFLSYSRQEHLKQFVVSVKRDLEREGLSVWLDIEDIPGGADRYASTGSALHNCKCLLPILTNCYVASKFSTSELYAADADNKHIVPLVYEPVDYQQSQKAMGVKYVVGSLQPISFIPTSDDYSSSMAKLVTALKQFGIGQEQECQAAVGSSEKFDLSSQMSGLNIGGDATPSAPYLPQPPPDYSDIFPKKQESVDGSMEPNFNPFRIGMKLEANDRRFPYYVCVATIEDIRGDEIKIHFDGWGPEYDYWCTYDMIELHPVGWCARNGYELQEPRGIPFSNWNKYLSESQAESCDAPMFNDIQTSPPGSLHFRVGMKLEAKDRKHPSLICVASIIDIDDKGQLLIHFDGWSEEYDYWCKPDSTDIHPPMWCGKSRRQLQPPNHYNGHFKWSQYLAEPANNPAPAHIFSQDQLLNAVIN